MAKVPLLCPRGGLFKGAAGIVGADLPRHDCGNVWAVRGDRGSNRARLWGAVPQETAAVNTTGGSCAADPARFRGTPRVACQIYSNACRI